MTAPPPNHPPPDPPSPPPPSSPPGGPPPDHGQGRPDPAPRRPGRLLGAGLAIAFVLALMVAFVHNDAPVGLLAGLAVFALTAATVGIAFERYRQYAVGFLLGLGIVLIVGGGACIGLIAVFAGFNG